MKYKLHPTTFGGFIKSEKDDISRIVFDYDISAPLSTRRRYMNYIFKLLNGETAKPLICKPVVVHMENLDYLLLLNSEGKTICSFVGAFRQYAFCPADRKELLKMAKKVKSLINKNIGWEI